MKNHIKLHEKMCYNYGSGIREPIQETTYAWDEKKNCVYSDTQRRPLQMKKKKIWKMKLWKIQRNHLPTDHYDWLADWLSVNVKLHTSIAFPYIKVDHFYAFDDKNNNGTL